jgi:hypothetical protein
MINEERIDYSAVMKALWQGRFYVSTGAKILSIVKDGDAVTIKTEGAASIHMRTGGRRSKSVFADTDTGLSEATFTLDPTDRYFRFKVRGLDGSVAYSQAYPID